jgi:hypothetical protein
MRNGCCCSDRSTEVVTERLWICRICRAASWIVPGVLLAAMPKCPLCLAAYVALVTGFGISLAVANFAWWFVAISCVAALMYLAVHMVRGLASPSERPRNTWLP